MTCVRSPYVEKEPQKHGECEDSLGISVAFLHSKAKPGANVIKPRFSAPLHLRPSASGAETAEVRKRRPAQVCFSREERSSHESAEAQSGLEGAKAAIRAGAVSAAAATAIRTNGPSNAIGAISRVLRPARHLHWQSVLFGRSSAKLACFLVAVAAVRRREPIMPSED